MVNRVILVGHCTRDTVRIATQGNAMHSADRELGKPADMGYPVDGIARPGPRLRVFLIVKITSTGFGPSTDLVCFPDSAHL